MKILNTYCTRNLRTFTQCRFPFSFKCIILISCPGCIAFCTLFPRTRKYILTNGHYHGPDWTFRAASSRWGVFFLPPLSFLCKQTVIKVYISSCTILACRLMQISNFVFFLLCLLFYLSPQTSVHLMDYIKVVPMNYISLHPCN